MNDDSPISRGVSVLGLSRSEINSPQISVITLHKRKPSISILVRINAEFPKYVWARLIFRRNGFKVCCFGFFTASYNELQERIARLRAVSFSSALVRGVHAREKRGRARSFACLGRFARRTNKKERLLVV